MAKLDHLQTSIQRTLSILYQTEVKDDRIGFLTITAVRLTNDFSHLTIYWTTLGNQDKRIATEKALIRSKGFVRSMLAQRVKMRKSPELHFKYDGSLDYGNKIEQGLKEVMKDEKE